MRPRLPADILVTLLRQCYFAPTCRSALDHWPVHLHNHVRFLRTSARRARQHGTSSEPGGHEDRAPRPTKSSPPPPIASGKTNTSKHEPENIAILGGGISGLASAHYLSKYLPNASITLYEASDTMGGWLQSKHVNIGDGKIVFEQGPRNIRPGTPAGLVTLALIKTIGLEDEIITTSRESVAARSRFVYYPDHLVRMPGPGQGIFGVIWRLMSEPIFEGSITRWAMEFDKPRRGSDLRDESVGSFLERRLGSKHFGDNVVSAILHGVYAGDIYQLSIKSLLPAAWNMESRYGSVSAGWTRLLTDGVREMREDDAALMSQLRENSELSGGEKALKASVYSFRQGIGALSDGLITSLRSNPKIRLRTGAKVTGIEFDGETNSVKVSISGNQPPNSYNQVISTISGRTLSQIARPRLEIPSLSKIYAVTVMVVNLYYSNPALLRIHGFGYLIPRSVPWNQNPERALGVVFDSDANVGQDTVPGTKVTVMFGGHWWDDWASYPDEAEGAAMAKAILKRHLKVEEEPVVVNVALQKECIPQYTVGHGERMKRAHTELMRDFRGKVAVAGNSYTGVGLNDCVMAARNVAQAIQRQGDDGVTGLESFTTEPKWIEFPGNSLGTVISKMLGK